ncbi:MAG: CAP domain-containing protein [Pseudobdellovibrionaceae bacterium]
MKQAALIYGLVLIFTFTFGACKQSPSGNGEASSISSDPPDWSNEPITQTPEDPPSQQPPTTTLPPPTASGDCVDTRTEFADRAIVEQVCLLVNQQRSLIGAKSLVLDAALSKVAQDFAIDMVQRGYFSHNTPEGLGPSDRMKAGGIIYRTWGENIAYYYKTPAAAMDGWMNSSGHKANILNGNFGKVGIGYYQNYWVQDFTN